MTKENAMHEQMQQIRQSIVKQELSSALAHLQSLAATVNNVKLNNDIDQLCNMYNSMLDYLRNPNAIVDDSTHKIQDTVTHRLLNVWSQLMREQFLANEHHPYTRAWVQTEVGDWDEAWSTTTDSDERFALQDRIFDYLWTSPLWKEQDTAFWCDFIGRQNALVQQHLIGAITLSLWMLWDKEKLTTIALFAQSDHEEVRLQATAGYIIAAQLYADLILRYPQTWLDAKNDLICQSVNLLQREFVLMKESEIVEQQENSELEAINKTHGAQPQMLEVVALRRRYIRLRMEEGLDTSLGKLPFLQMMPFLQRVAHWWAPFDESRSEVAKACYTKEGKENTAYRLIVAGSHECDLQKYLGCHMIAGSNVKLEVNGELTDDIIENIDVCPLPAPRRIAHNLYRIARHCPIHQLLPDIFTSLMFPANRVLLPFFSAEEIMSHALKILQIGAEVDLVPILLALEKGEGVSAALSRLIARTYLKQRNDYATALTYFRQADLLEDSPTDQLKEMALCCSRLQRKQEELTYLLRIYDIEPTSVACQTGLAQNYYQQGDYTEANKYLYRLLYEHPELQLVHAQLILSEMHLGRSEQAERQLKKMEECHPNHKLTFLMKGCYYFIQHNWDCAVANFKKIEGDDFTAHQHILQEFDIELSDINLLRDVLQL